MISSRLELIFEAFTLVGPQERLELLLEYAEGLPPLSDTYRRLRDEGLYIFRECQSPVFIVVHVTDQKVFLHADAPPETPTPRGFIAILKEAFDGELPEVVLQAPGDLLSRLHLDQVLGLQRRRGLSALFAHIKNEVIRQNRVSGV